MIDNDGITTIEKRAVDQMQRKIRFPYPPQRIISLVPSQTELLFALGVGHRVVGRTKFCIHPQPEINNVRSVGGTKQFRFDVIESLYPDLIIGNKEENYQEGIEQLTESYPVWMSDVRNLPQALEMITEIGKLVGKRSPSSAMVEEIEAQFAQLQPEPKRRVAYFIWHEPKMVVGSDTFINDMLDRCGFVNVFADDPRGRYPEVSDEEVQAADLDAILLSSEPFPFARKHTAEYQQLAPQAKITLTDGELFSWYGNRLLQAVPYFQMIQRIVSAQ